MVSLACHPQMKRGDENWTFTYDGGGMFRNLELHWSGSWTVPYLLASRKRAPEHWQLGEFSLPWGCPPFFCPCSCLRTSLSQTSAQAQQQGRQALAQRRPPPGPAPRVPPRGPKGFGAHKEGSLGPGLQT